MTPLAGRASAAAICVFYLAVPAAAGLLTMSRAIVGGGLPIEVNDETPHTFIDVPMFQQHLLGGTLLKIDLGQNFGTPLLGDPVVNPLAPHALTYAAFRPVKAMLINRVILADLTVAALTAFYAGYFGLPAASLCAILTFSSQGFLYSFQNHPHQGVLLYFTILLLTIRALLNHPRRRGVVLVFAAALAFALGVGLNGAILSVPFVAGFLLLAPADGLRPRLAALCACGLAVVSVSPHVFEFVRLATLSTRIHANNINHLETSSWVRLVELVVPVNLGAGVLVHYGPTLLILIACGVFRFARRSEELALRRLTLTLGLAPLVAVLSLLLAPAVIESIPLVRATNITRVVWFSDVFLMLAAGSAISWIADVRSPRRRGVLVAGLLLAVVAPRLTLATWTLSAFSATERDTTFQPPSFLPLLKAGYRLAADMDPVPGNFDGKAVPYGVLASSGRSILSNQPLRSVLEAQDLITSGGNGTTYYFKPSTPARLARFGIRYFAAGNDTDIPARLGWQPRATAGNVTLFESPLPVTAVYIDGPSPSFLDAYTIAGNGLSIDLPPGRTSYRVVATFAAIPGWIATIDGRRVPIDPDSSGLLAVQVPEGRRLSLQYEPYTTAWLFTVFLLPIFVIPVVARAMVPSHPGPHVTDRVVGSRSGKVAAGSVD